MDADIESQYLQLAKERGDVFCSQVPLGLLEMCALESEEPTEFLKELFSTGHTQWLAKQHGQGIRISKERMNNAIMVMWIRACRLQASQMLGRPDPGWEEHFFSDKGLYD